MKHFILIVKEAITTSRPDIEIKKIIELHIQWAKEMAEKGYFINGFGLNGQGYKLEMIGDDIISSSIPYPESAFSGMYIIQAPSIDIAMQIAKGCPTFSLGDKIEVRELI